MTSIAAAHHATSSLSSALELRYPIEARASPNRRGLLARLGHLALSHRRGVALHAMLYEWKDIRRVLFGYPVRLAHFYFALDCGTKPVLECGARTARLQCTPENEPCAFHQGQILQNVF